MSWISLFALIFTFRGGKRHPTGTVIDLLTLPYEHLRYEVTYVSPAFRRLPRERRCRQLMTLHLPPHKYGTPVVRFPLSILARSRPFVYRPCI